MNNNEDNGNVSDEEVINYPVICNDDGVPISFGTDDGFRHMLYCGRQDCRINGRNQCSSCCRLENDPERRMEFLQVLFPNLEKEEGVLVTAFRTKRGDIYESAQYLIENGAVPHVPFDVAFPAQPPNGRTRRLKEVNDDHVLAVQSIVGYDAANELGRSIVVSALRRQNHDEDQLVQATIGYIFDTSEDDLERNVAQDAEQHAQFVQEEEAREQRWQESIGRRNRVINEVKKKPIPSSVLGLKTEPFTATPTTISLNNNGHLMVDYSNRDSSSETLVPYCRVCACQVTSPFAGSRMCQTCMLCERCISFGIVFCCPMVGNGGHLYPRPLFPLRIGSSCRSTSCNVRGEGCLGSTFHHGRYASEARDFNVCKNCITKDVPPNYDWQNGRISVPPTPPPPPQQSDTNDSQAIPAPLPIERTAATIWEGDQMDDNNDNSDPEFIIGREIETGTDSDDDDDDDSDDENDSPPLPRNTSLGLSGRVDRKPLLPKEIKALQIFSGKTNAAACDIHHAESILLQANNRNDICEALLAGKVGIAGALLLADRYAPQIKKRKSASTSIDTNGAMVCFCGDVIDPNTAAVGCLNGHGMHPGCAADHLLGGGGCPFCNSPLFFPNVPGAETRDARKLAMEEMKDRTSMIEEESRIRDKKLQAEGMDISPKINDLVRISSDVNLCVEELMKDPVLCGWNQYMESACGMVGNVTKIKLKPNSDENQDGNQAVFCIRTKSGPNDSYNEHWWTLPVMTVVCRTATKGYELFNEGAALDQRIMSAAIAERHICHLRAELKVLVAARAAIEEEDGMQNETSISMEVSGSDLQCLQKVKKIISHFDWCRARHLVRLMGLWDDTEKVKSIRQAIYDILLQGDVDSASRMIRRYNTKNMIERMQQYDVVSTECKEYVVEKFAMVNLHVWPSTSAPRTGYYLDPKIRFISRSEVIDGDKNLWLKVDEKSFNKTQLNKLHGNPPPQGWLCTKPATNLPPVVRRTRSALRCFGCGDNFAPVFQPTVKYFAVKKNQSLSPGQELLVAATLEPVTVSTLEGDIVVCSFSNLSTKSPKKQRSSLENHTFQARYRRKDLVYLDTPGNLTKNSTPRETWENSNGNAEGEGSDSYASCVRGHLLHPRCFQAALLAGEGCPAPGCGEPLWVPKIRRKRNDDDDTCCGANNNVIENVLEGQAGLTSFLNSQSEDNFGNIEEGELKMCPVCYSGPFLHERCSDMAAHHGQCVARALGEASCSFRVSATDIAKILRGLPADQSIMAALPKCPTHDIPVLFNGCTNCGHLFTQTSWNNLPNWDQTAKAALDVDKEKREQAKLFAIQIREEASILQFDRDALEDKWGENIKEENTFLFPRCIEIDS